MADSNDIAGTPEFIQELLPSVERTALLYHLSYMCLGNFPKLQCLLREQALETQLLFGSSEALLLKCVGTSSSLDSSLFPKLVKTIKKNKPDLALMYQEIAKTRIDDITGSVDDIVTRYEQHKQRVKMCTTVVFQEQKDTEKQLTQHFEEIRTLEEAVAKLKEDLRKQNGNWEIQVKLTDVQLQLGLSRTKLGVIPSTVHLKDVQQCLSRIQHILLQLQKFWEKVGALLDSLKNTTFAAEDLIEELDDLKEEILSSIETAGKRWNKFSGSCRSAKAVFSIQSKGAYTFLEINPSSLSENERTEQYKSIMEKLNQISLQY